MTTAACAIEQLCRHRGITRVGTPEFDNDGSGRWRVEIDIPVELPSRAQTAGISATGVKAMETCALVFRNWPLRAPRPLLRRDFPRDLPHINPHSAGGMVPPCIYEGSLDELLHDRGLDAVVDQLIDWLGKAASGTLIDLSQGWEPTRRDRCPSTAEFSAERLIAVTPADGKVMTISARYLAVGDGVYCRLLPALTPQADATFTQDRRGTPENPFSGGILPAFVARAAAVGGQFPVLGKYQPDTVVDLPSLLELASALGIDAGTFQTTLADFYRAQVLGLQDYTQWTKGLYALVVLVVKRPAPLVGSDGRDVEVLPYVLRYDIDPNAPLEHHCNVHPAFHSHVVSPALLARTSGLPQSTTQAKVVLIGCGSLGSKVSMHLARAGIGQQILVDNEVMSPHNLARHAMMETSSLALHKAEKVKNALNGLSHLDAKAFNLDAIQLLTSSETFAEVVPPDAILVIDTTASLQVLVASACSGAMSESPVRLARAALFGQGRCAVLVLEAQGRESRVDDITVLVFEMCRWNPGLRGAMIGNSSELQRIFVGDNCRSLTTSMSDALISRSAAMVAMQVQKWISDGKPTNGQLCVGLGDTSNIGSAWQVIDVGKTLVIDVQEDGGWQVRVLAHVEQAIDEDARYWGNCETGGALLGHVSFEARTITIAGLVPAPIDSVRSEATFLLGTEGLNQTLVEAHATSLGHLMFVGTWHSHPMGGSHSGIDKDTLKKIATDARGFPAVSLVWTPQGFICAVDRW
ncbi:ThiF family adenylyltransferase [Variovorax sp. J22G73]|uniref:ThiF family adenylyltransferase n=1 Tax=unclassified Variovorax TaxID=663243 RepID=UPI0025784479|nr:MULTISPECIES: ThiF family adenylyltransferase [unclassified Variovorax]MDM0008383.1 ThiF family adenylyltransferase [Variovorax sp. J22R203]MDM0100890.1 ThiF family adenylyltransferase [Variovorax sp. J22G73]